MTTSPKPFTISVNNLDLASMQIPRRTPSLEEQVNRTYAETGARTYLAREMIAAGRAPGTPFLTAVQGRAEAILWLDSLEESEEHNLCNALTEGRALLVPHMVFSPTYSVLCLKLAIYDQPELPYFIEAARDLCDGDVQDYLTALFSDGDADLHLFCGVGATFAASGKLSLRSPPFESTTFPYRTTAHDFDTFRQLLRRGAEHLHRIPDEMRDFAAAADLYFQKISW